MARARRRMRDGPVLRRRLRFGLGGLLAGAIVAGFTLGLVTPGCRLTVVAFGDSLTAGSGVYAGEDWPSVFAAGLRADMPEIGWRVVNQGVPGNRLLSDEAGPAGIDRFADAAMLAERHAAVVVLIGINDIGGPRRDGTGPRPDAPALIAGLERLAGAARAAGMLALGGTLMPAGGSIRDIPGAEATRQAVNAWIRAAGRFDVVVDFDRAVADPADPTRLAAAFDGGDHLHLNAAGNRRMAETLPLAAFRPLAARCPP